MPIIFSVKTWLLLPAVCLGNFITKNTTFTLSKEDLTSNNLYLTDQTYDENANDQSIEISTYIQLPQSLTFNTLTATNNININYFRNNFTPYNSRKNFSLYNHLFINASLKPNLSNPSAYTVITFLNNNQGLNASGNISMMLDNDTITFINNIMIQFTSREENNLSIKLTIEQVKKDSLLLDTTQTYSGQNSKNGWTIWEIIQAVFAGHKTNDD